MCVEFMDQKLMKSELKSAVEAIKTAILQGQYEASKGVNRVQLAVYYGIGKYISAHTRKGVWGLGSLIATIESTHMPPVNHPLSLRSFF